MTDALRADNKVLTLLNETAAVADDYISPEVVGGHDVILFLNISDDNGVYTLDVKLQALEPVSDTWIDIPGAAFAQAAATGSQMLSLAPGLSASANVRVNDRLPGAWRAFATVGGAGDCTFSVSADIGL